MAFAFASDRPALKLDGDPRQPWQLPDALGFPTGMNRVATCTTQRDGIAETEGAPIKRPWDLDSIMAPPLRTVGSAQLADIVGAVSRGDELAFEQLYAATCAKLYAIVLRITRHQDIADDLLQETYLRIWQHSGRYDARRASPITWMATIARNCALDTIKRPRLAALEEHEPLEATNGDSPHLNYERTENARRLWASLGRLGPEKSRLIVQAYCFGMTREELAKVTGRPVSTIKTWLRRTLIELRCHMEEEATMREPKSTPRRLDRTTRDNLPAGLTCDSGSR